MRTTALVFLFVVAAAVPQRGTWDSVLALQPGVVLEVEERARVMWDGKLESANADGVLLENNGERLTISRAAITRVVQVGERNTGRYAKRGFLIGLGLGIVQVLVGVRSNVGAFLLVYPPIEGAVGAAIGAADGVRSRKRIVIYEAKLDR